MLHNRLPGCTFIGLSRSSPAVVVMAEQLKFPLVYIIILTWNQRALTADCLRSVSQMTYPNYRIVVVDNGSVDDTVEFIQREFPEVTLIKNPYNRGFASGSNTGILFALAHEADYILLLNNDTTVYPDFLEKLIAVAQALPNAGILMPQIIEDRKDKVWFTGSQKHWLTLDATDFGRYGPCQIVNEEIKRVDYVFGTAMMIRRAVIEDIGLLDESFFMYYEDMDFCLRAQSAGYGIYYVGTTAVRHRISASTSTEERLPFRYYHKAYSSVVFFRKHTKGIRLLFVIPYRVGSALCTLLRLVHRREVKAMEAYIRGLIDALLKEPRAK